GAINPNTKSFTGFKTFVANHLDPATTPAVAMFCTGGIRCEKASAYLLAHGFEHVYHLKGGILAYLERFQDKWTRLSGSETRPKKDQEPCFDSIKTGYARKTVPADQSQWEGECFVFDERVSVTHGLVPGTAVLCRGCRHPLLPADLGHPDYEAGIKCHHCAGAGAKKHARAAQRHYQIELAAARGQMHLGTRSSVGE
ncbi:MAG: hypothetical protein GXP01_02910, partial [Alphaproteobacteria bacterium]|nr:hypothetical protein [Alphaproteobacteria bacterium]